MLYKHEQIEDYPLFVVGTYFIMRMLQNRFTWDASEVSPPTGFSFLLSGFSIEIFWPCLRLNRPPHPGSLGVDDGSVCGLEGTVSRLWLMVITDSSAFHRASNLLGQCAVHLIPVWSQMEVVIADKTGLPLDFLLSG